MLGMANKIDWIVDASGGTTSAGAERHRNGGREVRVHIHLESAGDSGSKFTLSGDFEGAMIKGALGKAVEKDGAKQLDKTLAQLDRAGVGRCMPD